MSYYDVVPKELGPNLHFRQAVYRECRHDKEFRSVVLQACKKDPLFFIAIFGWLQEVRPKAEWQQIDRFGENDVLPFIPREYQARRIKEMVEALGKRDIIVPKSRETGMSWMAVALAVWDILFNGAHIGFVSRDENSVDAPGPGSLFSKVQFFLDHLPRWMCNKNDYTRNLTEHTITHHESGGTLHGVASGPNIFRGDRKKWVLMDEAHFFKDDYAARDSLVGVTRCRMMVSTLNRERGASGAFFDAWENSGPRTCVIEIDWTEDHDKATGLYMSDGGRLRLIDESFWDKYRNDDGTFRHPYEPGLYDFILDDNVRSLYYDFEDTRAGVNRQTLAAELDRDVTGATAQLCDGKVLKAAKTRCSTPVKSGSILQCFRDDQGRKPKEPWEFDWTFGDDCQLWTELINGRPPIGEYYMGADISSGTGGDYSSYSALVVYEHATGEQVFQWRSNTVNPIIFASLARFVGLWFHEAHFAPEANGIGAQFIKELMKLGYPNIYKQKRGQKTYEEDSDKPGYYNNDGGSEILLALEQAIKLRRVKINSRLILDEMQNYFYGKGGKVVQAKAQSAEDMGARGQAHGDAAIAAAVGHWAFRDLPEWAPEPEPDLGIPPNSFAARRAEARERQRPEQPAYWQDY